MRGVELRSTWGRSIYDPSFACVKSLIPWLSKAKSRPRMGRGMMGMVRMGEIRLEGRKRSLKAPH